MSAWIGVGLVTAIVTIGVSVAGISYSVGRMVEGGKAAPAAADPSPLDQMTVSRGGPLTVVHDDGRGVTCWIAKLQGGLACLPDSMLPASAPAPRARVDECAAGDELCWRRQLTSRE